MSSELQAGKVQLPRSGNAPDEGIALSSDSIWGKSTLRNAGVTLIDCDHRTPQQATEGYPYIAIPQLKDGHIRLDGVRLISKSDYLDWTKKLTPQADDVIVVRRCNSGDSAVVPAGLECAIGQNLVILRSDGQRIHQKFLRWLLRGPDWWEQVDKFINVGAVFDSLKCREIPEFQLTIPPLEAQKEIATVLGSLDARIELLRETNATLEAMAQALFKSWFVDFDPVHANASTKQMINPASSPSDLVGDPAAPLDSRLRGNDDLLPPELQTLFPATFTETPQGLVPEGWCVGTIADLASVKGGFAYKSTDFSNSGLPVLKIKNIVGDGTVDVGDVQRISQALAEKTNRFALADGDVLMAMTGATIGKVGVVVTLNDETPYLNQRVAKFEEKKPNESNAWLIFTAFQNAFMTEQIINAASGSAQPNISAAGIESAKLTLPNSNEVLRAFDDAVSPLFSVWINNHKQAQTLVTLRDTLLPRLISGQLRLPEADAMQAEVCDV